jgi:hypothetical protein
MDGPCRNPEDRSDLGRRQADVVGQDQRRALRDGEFEERSFELVAIDQLAERIVCASVLDLEAKDLDGPPGPPPRLIRAGADEEAMQPRVEPFGIAERAQVAPGSDESFLDGVLRGISVAKDPPRDRVQAVVCGGREGIECLVVAPLCAFDELGRHADPSLRRGHLPRSPSMASGRHRILHSGPDMTTPGPRIRPGRRNLALRLQRRWRCFSD